MTNAQNIAFEAVVNYGVDFAIEGQLSGTEALEEIMADHEDLNQSASQWTEAFVRVLTKIRDCDKEMLATCGYDAGLDFEVRRCNKLIADVSKTIAQQIADRFHNDGQCFETDDGVEINDVIEELRECWWQNDEMEAAISVFADGSMIVMQSFWDIITEYRGMLRDSNGEHWGSLDEEGDLITGDSLLTSWRRRYC